MWVVVSRQLMHVCQQLLLKFQVCVLDMRAACETPTFAPRPCAVFDSLNGVPEALHGADVTRVRQAYLDGAVRRYRQSVLLSSFASPEMNALLARSCASHAGKAKLVARHKVSSVSWRNVMHGNLGQLTTITL